MDGSGFCSTVLIETGSSAAVRASAMPVADGCMVEAEMVVEDGVVSARDRGTLVVTLD